MLSKLPAEIAAKVSKHLPIKDRAALEQTSCKIKESVRSEYTYWKAIKTYFPYLEEEQRDRYLSNPRALLKLEYQKRRYEDVPSLIQKIPRRLRQIILSKFYTKTFPYTLDAEAFQKALRVGSGHKSLESLENDADSLKVFALFSAIRNGKKNLAHQLLEKYAYRNISYYEVVKLFEVTVQHRHYFIMEALLKKFRQRKFKERASSAYILAAGLGDIAMMKILDKYWRRPPRARRNKLLLHRARALKAAAEKKQRQVIKYLLKKGFRLLHIYCSTIDTKVLNDSLEGYDYLAYKIINSQAGVSMIPRLFFDLMFLGLCATTLAFVVYDLMAGMSLILGAILLSSCFGLGLFSCIDMSIIFALHNRAVRYQKGNVEKILEKPRDNFLARIKAQTKIEEVLRGMEAQNSWKKSIESWFDQRNYFSPAFEAGRHLAKEGHADIEARFREKLRVG